MTDNSAPEKQSQPQPTVLFTTKEGEQLIGSIMHKEGTNYLVRAGNAIYLVPENQTRKNKKKKVEEKSA